MIKKDIILKAINCAENNIIITDSDGKILWCNDNTYKSTGYYKSEIIGENPRIFKHEDNSPEIYIDMWEIIKVKKCQWKGKIKNKRKDGSYYIEELCITPVLDENDNIEYFIGVQQDITELEELKIKLKQRIEDVQKVTQKLKRKYITGCL
jgi:PAS domain S-box-containing protein